MAALTEADVSGEAMPYMSSKRMDVAGVPSLVLRIGFVGEMGYEIHFPSAYGEHLWDTIMETGAAAGSPRSAWRPSGSSASRSSTSSWARTPTPSPIRSRSGSAGW